MEVYPKVRRSVGGVRRVRRVRRSPSHNKVALPISNPLCAMGLEAGY
jgi:hypothetical protein